MINFKKIIAIVFCMFAIVALRAEMYYNEEYNFSLDLPQGFTIEQTSKNTIEGSTFFIVWKDIDVVISIVTNKLGEGYKISYNDYRNYLLNEGNTIIDEHPFYDLVRQDIVTVKNDTYEKTLLKANSFIFIGADYPLSADAEYIISTFDNHRTWRGDWWRFKSNFHWLIRFLFFTLIVLFGILSRGHKYSWIFVCLSVLLFVIEFICLWQSKAVLSIVFIVTFSVWLIMFSQNKKLIWLADSIFGN